MAHHTRQTPSAPRRFGRVLLAALAAALVAMMLVALGWRVTGGRWMVVQTPSMGTTAPVGTLVLTRPTTVAALHVGDVVSFHATPTRVYTHRVKKISNGVLTTQGDVNGAPDSFRTTDRQLVGKVVYMVRGAGWIVRGLPLAAILLGLLWWLTNSRWVKHAWRSPLRVAGTAMIVSFVAAMLKPFVGVAFVTPASQTDGSKQWSLTVISSGLLPTRVSVAHGTSAVLHSGQIAQLTASGTDALGRVAVHAGLALSGWWLVGVVLACAAPLLYSLIVSLAPWHKTEAVSA